MIALYITIYNGSLFVLRAGFCISEIRFVMFAPGDGGRPKRLAVPSRCHGIPLRAVN
jgi:hypothetical protein